MTYFVVLDSDEVIPADFISQSLKYFQFDEKIGALQAYHLNKKGKNLFQYLMSISANAQSLESSLHETALWRKFFVRSWYDN
nr:hypothetical protein [Mycoplasmopsis bovis]